MSDFRLSTYYPTSTLSDSGRKFLDHTLGTVFENVPREQIIDTHLMEDVSIHATSIVVDGVHSLQHGDVLFISNQKYTKIYTQYTVDGNTVNILDAQQEVWERCIVDYVVDGNVIYLKTPLTTAYSKFNKVRIHNQRQDKHHILFEIASGMTSSVKGSQLLAPNLLTTYETSSGSGIYEIPVNDELFVGKPDISSIQIEYIDPRFPSWIQMTSGEDFEYIPGSPDVIRITNTTDSPVSHPQKLTTPIQLKLVKISYDTIQETGLEIGNPTLKALTNKGEFLHADGSLTFDSTNKYVGGIPNESPTLMAIADAILKWHRVDESQERTILDHIAYMLGLHNGFDSVPLTLQSLILSSRDLFSSLGSRMLLKRIAALLGIENIYIDEEYVISSAPGTKQYEKFYLHQPYLPSYRAVKNLFDIKDDSASITQTGSTGWGFSGALTNDTVTMQTPTVDEAFDFVIGNVQTSQIGLTTASTFGYAQNEIQYGIELRDVGGVSEIWIVENGTLLSTTSEATYSPSDRITFALVGTDLQIFIGSNRLTHNGTPYSITLPVGSYHLAATLNSYGASILDITKIASDGRRTTVTFSQTQNVDVGFSILGKELLPFLYPTFFATSPISGAYGDSPFGQIGYGTGSTVDFTYWSELDLKRAYAYFSDSKIHNLLTNPEQFNTTPWTTLNLTVQEDTTVAAPEPGKNAWKCTASNIYEPHVLELVGFTLPSTESHFLSFYIKAGTISSCDLIALNDSTGGTAKATFNLLTTEMIQQIGSLIQNAGIEHVGSGWHRIWIEISPDTTGPYTFELHIGMGASGDPNGDAWIFGAALYESVLEPYHDRIAKFNQAVHSSIRKALELEVSYRNIEVFPLSTFVVTSETTVTLLDSPESHLPTVFEHVKPFSRIPTKFVNEVINKFQALNMGIPPLPLPTLYLPFVDSIYPMIGLDDGLTFSRIGQVSFIDSSNHLKWANANQPVFETISSDNNLLKHSEEFTAPTSWVGYGVIPETNTLYGLNGTILADKFTITPYNEKHFIEQSVSVTAGKTYTFSVYVKPYKTMIELAALVDSNENSFAGFDLENLTVVKTGGAPEGNTYIDSHIQSVQNGWIRVGLTFSPKTSGTTRLRIGLTPTKDVMTRTMNAFLGDGRAAFWLWGAQLSESNGFVRYIRTKDNPVPRLTAFRVDSKTTNVCAFSEDFYTPVWSLLGNATVTRELSISGPDGQFSAFRLSMPTSGSGISQPIQNVISPAVYTYSIWLRTVSGTADVWLRNPDGTKEQVSVNSTWKRYVTTGSINPTIAALEVVNLSNLAVDILIYGAQAELGLEATSYVRTLNVEATSFDSNLTYRVDGNIVPQAREHSIAFSFIVPNSNTSARLFTVSGSNQSIDVTTGNLAYTNGTTIVSGSVGTKNISNYTLHVGAVTYKAEVVRIYVDGVLVGQGNVTVSSGSQLSITFAPFGTQTVYVSDFRVYDKELTDTEVNHLNEMLQLSTPTYLYDSFGRGTGNVIISPQGPATSSTTVAFDSGITMNSQ